MCPCPIDMYIIFKHPSFRKPLGQSKPNFLWSQVSVYRTIGPLVSVVLGCSHLDTLPVLLSVREHRLFHMYLDIKIIGDRNTGPS